MECSFCGTKDQHGDAFCGHCGAPLSPTAGTVILANGTNPAIHVQTMRSQQQKGRYEIQKILGKGRIGAVLLAVDHLQAKKPVIIKELIPSHADPTNLQFDLRDFARQANILAQLKHPLIPCVIDHFQEKSRYFIVLDYIEGENLEAVLYRVSQPLPESEVLAYASEVLDVLEYLGQQRPPIIHRDIKPTNIIIGTRDSHAHLVDFGIARASDSLIGQNELAGTPGYSPPEQYRGEADARADLYALAACMHYALTHRDPYRHTPFQFPPARMLNPNLSPEIEHILARALDTSSSQCYQSAREMKQDIDDLLWKRYDVSGYQSQMEGLPLLPELTADGKAVSSPSQPGLTFSSQSSPIFVQPDLLTTPPGTSYVPSLRSIRHRQWLQQAQKRKNLLVIAGLLVLLFSLALYEVLPLLSPSSSRSVSHKGTPMPTLPASIGVMKAPDGELIGISDGSYVFDTTGPAAALKEQAAQKLRRGDIGSALSWLSEAHSQDTSDAEALIYQENLRVINSRYITIVVGTTLTGDASSIASGHENLQGAYVAQKEYNDTAEQHGGVKVRLLIANSGSITAYVSLIAQQIVRLAQKDKTIVGVMGWPQTPPTFAAITPLSQAQIPLVSYAAGDNLTDISKYFFRISAPASEFARVGALYAMKTLKAKSVAIFTDPANDYTRSLADDFEANITGTSTGSGMAIVATEKYTVGDAAKQPQRLVTELQDALQYHPDIVYFAGYPADVSVLLQHMYSYDPLVLGGPSLYSLGSYSDVTSSGKSHLRFATLAYPDEWDILHLSAQKPPFFSDYPQAFGPGNPESPYGFTRADGPTMQSYDTTLVLLQASKLLLKNKYPLTGSGIQQALAEITGKNAFQGVTGQIAFNANGNSINKAIAIICNKDGFFKLDMVEGQFLLNGPVLSSYPSTSVCA